MSKRTNTLYPLKLIFTFLSRSQKTIFHLSFLLLLCLFNTSIAVDEYSDEYVGKVRTFLFNKAAIQRKDKVIFSQDVVKETGVSRYIIGKFFDSEEINHKYLTIILNNFKTNYPKASKKFVASLTPDSSQKTANISSSSLKTESNREYPCLNICALPFHISFPDTYSLFMVDSALISCSTVIDWDQHANFNNIGRRFLRPSIATDTTISFAETEQEGQEKKHWILQCEQTFSASSGEKKPYYIVQLFKRHEEQRTANLIKSLTKNFITASNGFEFQAALLIFPYLDQKAMVYGMGQWNTLLNPDCTIPQWGLRVASSGQICNPNRVKSLKADHYRTSNPFLRQEKAAELRPIEVFGLEVGSEELKSISLMPNRSVKTHHVLEATDHLLFTVNPRETATCEQTLQSLDTIAIYFFTLAMNPEFRIHSRMREFIDDEIKNDDLVAALNREIIESLKTFQKKNEKEPERKIHLFLHDILWREMKNKKLFVGEGEDKKYLVSTSDIFSQLTSQNPYPQEIKVWRPRDKNPKKFDPLRIVYSLPFEYKASAEDEEKFYRFDRNHWYQVDTSRFEGIKRILRETKIHGDTLHLPTYKQEDTVRSGEKKADYKEAKYNIRAAQTINKGSNRDPAWQSILLDRINICLGEASHKFEFADLLIIHDKTFYIVHVKRACASALSHHREQVERSADFLTTELNKKNAQELLLKGVINGLYEENGLPTKKEKDQGKRITKGSIFLGMYNNLSSDKNLVSKLINIKKIEQNKSKRLLNFSRQILKVLEEENNKEFFNDYPNEFVSAIDALFDCVAHKKEQFADEAISGFLKAVKQTIEARKFLFPNGHIEDTDLKKIKLVLALIDDREVDATSKGKKTNTRNALFNPQDLWGLDRTRTMVEKAGLGFNLVVINEDTSKEGDSFGKIIKKEKKENFINMVGDEPELIYSPSVKISLPPSTAKKPPQQLQKKSLKELYKQIKGFSNTLDLSIVQKLEYIEGDETYTYLTCPTIGDGNCFFHAAFTDDGETPQDLTDKATEMRKDLCDAIDEGQYTEDVKPLVYEHYMELLTNDPSHTEVPRPIKEIILRKDEYSTMYNSMQRFSIDTARILAPEIKFPVENIQALITLDNIKTYMERFLIVGGDETYILVRPDIKCPADILASQGKKRINIFTFSPKSKQLNFLKTAGRKGPVIDLLHDGNHFVRLYNPDDNKDNYLKQCEQIRINHDSWNPFM